MGKKLKRTVCAVLTAAALICMTSLTACGKSAWDIKVNGKSIDMPCNLDDMGDGYDYDFGADFSGISAGDDMFSVVLMQDDDNIGTAKVEADSKDDIDRKSKIHQLSIVKSMLGKDVISVAGVKCGADKSEVKKAFGEPDDPNATIWKYDKDGFKTMVFFDTEGKVTMLSISDDK